MHRRRLEEDLSRSAPNDDHAADRLLERLNIGAELVGEVHLVLASLDIGAVQALDVVLVKNCRHRLDRFEVGANRFELVPLKHLGVGGGLVDVIVEDVPAGKDDIVQVGQRHEVLDQRRVSLGALAQPNRSHLRERADRLGQSLADRLNSGDQCSGDGAQADDHNSQFALSGLNLRCVSAGKAALVGCWHCYVSVLSIHKEMQNQNILVSTFCGAKRKPLRPNRRKAWLNGRFIHRQMQRS